MEDVGEGIEDGTEGESSNDSEDGLNHEIAEDSDRDEFTDVALASARDHDPFGRVRRECGIIVKTEIVCQGNAQSTTFYTFTTLKVMMCGWVESRQYAARRCH